MFRLGLLLLLSVTGSAQTFDQFEELVHIIKLKASAESDHQGRGTGFVVNKDGAIVTNYHVISGIFTDGKRDKAVDVFVKVKAQWYLAEVVSFDIDNDLALLKVPHVFDQQVQLSQVPLAKGDKIFSLGFHDTEFMAINQGTFNAYLKYSENQLLAITCPLNPGMSGGPILDKNFEVAGVNVLRGRKESDGYGINAKKVMEFLERVEPKDKLALEERLRKQMQASYRRVIASVDIAHERRTMNSWELLSFDNFMECGEFQSDHNPNEDVRDVDKNRILSTTRMCNLDPRKVPLSMMDADLSFSYAIANIRKSENTRPATYYKYLNDSFKFENLKSSLLGEKYRCRRAVIENDQGLKLKTSICSFKPKKVPNFLEAGDFYRFEVKAVSMTPTMDNVRLVAQFSGSKELAKQIIKKVINGIRLKRD